MEINSDFTFLYPDFENKWIVLSLDHRKVLYSANNLDELSYEQVNEGVVMKVPVSGVAYA